MSDGYLGKVLDNNGVTQSGEEAVKVWSAHFREVLQGSKEPPAGEFGLSVCREAPQGVSMAVIIQSWKVKLLKRK